MLHAQTRAQVLEATSLAARICAVAIAGLLLLGLALPSSAAAVTTTDRREAVLHYTNKARKAKGCHALKMSRRLTKSSQRHASDMAAKNYFGHTSINGRSWDARIRAAGYDDPGGENIAYGFKTAKSVVNAWMRSPSHRRNILTCSFKKIGVGYAKSDGIWVQDFGY